MIKQLKKLLNIDPELHELLDSNFVGTIVEDKSGQRFKIDSLN